MTQQGMLLSPCATPFLHEGAASAVSSLQDRLWRLQSKTLTPPPPHTHTHTHTHARKHTHKDTHMHRSTLTRASTHSRAHTRTPYMNQLHDSRHFCAHTCTTHAYTHKHTPCTRTSIHTRTTHTYMHTHTHTRVPTCSRSSLTIRLGTSPLLRMLLMSSRNDS